MLHCIGFYFFIDRSLFLLHLYYEILKFLLEFFYLSNLQLMIRSMARNSLHLSISFMNLKHMVLLGIYILAEFYRLSNLFQSLKFQVYWFPPSRTFQLNRQYYLNYLKEPILLHFHNLDLNLFHFIRNHPTCKRYCFLENSNY